MSLSIIRHKKNKRGREKRSREEAIRIRNEPIQVDILYKLLSIGVSL